MSARPGSLRSLGTQWMDNPPSLMFKDLSHWKEQLSEGILTMHWLINPWKYSETVLLGSQIALPDHHLFKQKITLKQKSFDWIQPIGYSRFLLGVNECMKDALQWIGISCRVNYPALCPVMLGYDPDPTQPWRIKWPMKMNEWTMFSIVPSLYHIYS